MFLLHPTKTAPHADAIRRSLHGITFGRNYRSILARTFFVLALANAESVVEEMFPGPWQEERERLGRLGVQGVIGGEPGLAAYTPGGQMDILFTSE